MFCPLLAGATLVETEITGVEGAELSNVRAHLSLVHAENMRSTAIWRLRQMAYEAPGQVRQALQPLGYYRPEVTISLREPEQDGLPWRALIDIDPGPAVVVAELDMQLTGEGRDDPVLQQWLADWPLPVGSIMQDELWESAWRSLVEIASAQGYFDHRFVQRRFWIDVDSDEAVLRLHFDSGRRFRFGVLQGPTLPFREHVLQRLTVIEPNEPYTVQRVDEQREVFAGSGLFDRIVIEEQRDEDAGVVDLSYELNLRPPNSYRLSAGFGTDSGVRLQLRWIRHYLSELGNRLDSGVGVQQRDSEFVVRSEYLHPRGSEPGAFLTAGGVARRQHDEFRLSDESRRQDVFDPFSGRREQLELRLGHLEQRPLRSRHFQALDERLFLAVLHESFDAARDAGLSADNEAVLAANPELASFLQTETNTLSLGANWRLSNFQGSGFFSHGHILEARILAASESLGSDVSFAQGYLEAKIHRVFGHRHKLLVGGEVGYSDAAVRKLDLTVDDRRLALSMTELPERYRFKTGGDRSVRGYAFETLSTNRNGANHLLTGSLEYEYRVGNNWSVGAFYDVGNAFNDWSDVELRRGLGVGLRFYTPIGPIQFDIARPLDDADRSQRVHFTIGTRLL